MALIGIQTGNRIRRSPGASRPTMRCASVCQPRQTRVSGRWGNSIRSKALLTIFSNDDDSPDCQLNRTGMRKVSDFFCLLPSPQLCRFVMSQRAVLGHWYTFTVSALPARCWLQPPPPRTCFCPIQNTWKAQQGAAVSVFWVHFFLSTFLKMMWSEWRWKWMRAIKNKDLKMWD